MESHISQLNLLCPKGGVGRVGKKDGLVQIEHFCIRPLQPGEVVMVVCIVDRHLRLNCSYFMSGDSIVIFLSFLENILIDILTILKPYPRIFSYQHQNFASDLIFHRTNTGGFFNCPPKNYVKPWFGESTLT